MNWGWGTEKVTHIDSHTNTTKKIVHSKQDKNDGWCTYDYWQSGNGLFNQNKEMITVNPH